MLFSSCPTALGMMPIVAPAETWFMHDKEITDRFIALRARKRTFSSIMAELNVSRPTLIAWSRKYQYEIQNAQAIELEALREKWLSDVSARIDALGQQLRAVEAELAQRSLADLSTRQLYSMADSLRHQIDQETGPMKFTSPLAEIPNDEYHEQVQDWVP